MSIFEVIIAALPLLNFLLIWVLKPVFNNAKILQETVKNQQQEIKELKKMNESLREEVRLLKELVFKTIPAEQLQNHLLCHLNEKCKG